MRSDKEYDARDEVVDGCVDAIRDGSATPDECLAGYTGDRDEIEPTLKAASAVSGAANAVAPDPEFKSALKDRLEKEAGATGRVMPGRFMFKLAAAIAALGVITGGVGYASTDSLPDSPLYPVKQLIEKIRLAAAGDEAAEVETHLALAEERLAEVDAMVEAGKTDEARQALNDMSKEMREAYRLAGMVPGQDREILLAKFAIISQRHLFVLQGVYERAPDSAKPAIERVMEESAKGLDKADEAVLKLEKNREREEAGETDTDSDDADKGKGKPENTPGKGNDKTTDDTGTSGQSTNNNGNGQGQGSNKN